MTIRTQLRDLLFPPRLGAPTPCSHFGLAYTVLFPFAVSKDELADPDRDGAKNDAAKSQWLAALEENKPAADYARFHDLWSGSFPDARRLTFTLESRLLTGAGNPSAAQIGLTVHHTWGVPVLPGSGLKGLLAGWVAANIGAADSPDAADWRGPLWADRKLKQSPGKYYAQLFGAPAEPNSPGTEFGGRVVFHDALWKPGSAGGKPFIRDVLTVHHKDYYDNAGGKGPNDWTSPNPVAFMTIRPGAQFLIPLTPADPESQGWVDLAAEWLPLALKDWGFGAKTSLGYGIGSASPA